jgi:hypothetical protein
MNRHRLNAWRKARDARNPIADFFEAVGCLVMLFCSTLGTGALIYGLYKIVQVLLCLATGCLA